MKLRSIVAAAGLLALLAFPGRPSPVQADIRTEPLTDLKIASIVVTVLPDAQQNNAALTAAAYAAIKTRLTQLGITVVAPTDNSAQLFFFLEVKQLPLGPIGSAGWESYCERLDVGDATLLNAHDGKPVAATAWSMDTLDAARTKNANHFILDELGEILDSFATDYLKDNPANR